MGLILPPAWAQNIRVMDGGEGMNEIKLTRTNRETQAETKIKVSLVGTFEDGYVRRLTSIRVDFDGEIGARKADVELRFLCSEGELIANRDYTEIRHDDGRSKGILTVSGQIVWRNADGYRETCKLTDVVFPSKGTLDDCYLVGRSEHFASIDLGAQSELRELLVREGGGLLSAAPRAFFALSDWGFTSDLTALHVATREGYTDVVRKLIAAEALIDARDSDNQTALGAAISSQSEAIVALLLSAGASLDSEKGAATPLMLAVWSGNEGIVNTLLHAGADVNVSSGPGYAPLHYAAYRGHLSLCELLIAKGADHAAKTGAGETPLDLSRAREHDKVARFLESLAAKK
ncbi:MAG: hypothetical protein ACI9K5_001493 [Gammaproteobacteria bacterium]|jgi:hypothetical protein